MNYLAPLIFWDRHGTKRITDLYTGDAFDRTVVDTVKACWNHTRINKYGNKGHDSVEKYLKGYLKPHYPVPALLVDCVSDLSIRWSSWLDTDAQYGMRR